MGSESGPSTSSRAMTDAAALPEGTGTCSQFNIMKASHIFSSCTSMPCWIRGFVLCACANVILPGVWLYRHGRRHGFRPQHRLRARKAAEGR